MTVAYRSWVVTVVFLLLGLATRLYHLDWSASGDHTSTFKEVQSLVEKPFFLTNLEPSDILPRIAPVSYVLHVISFEIFGTTEAGSRTGSAIAGTAAIGASVFLVARLYSLTQATILGAMLVLWPWLLLHSQSNRFYCYGFLFTSLALLTTCTALHRNSFKWGAIGGILTALAISSHAMSAVMPAGLILFLLVEFVTKRDALQGRALKGYLLFGVPLMLVSVSLVLWAFVPWVPMVVEAAAPSSSRLAGIAYNISGLAFNVGWSVILLSLVGWVLAWRSDNAVDRICAMVGVAVAVVCVLGPYAISVFRADYLFSSSLVFFILASRVLARTYDTLSASSRTAAIGVVAAVILCPLPSFISYYMDGNRKDYRSAAAFIEKHLLPGDLVAADTVGALGYYLDIPIHGAGRPSTSAPRTVATLSALASKGGRVWYVCRFAREEPSSKVDRWFWQNSVRMLRIKRKRFDYHMNILDVYLFNPSAEDRELIESEVPRGEPLSA